MPDTAHKYYSQYSKIANETPLHLFVTLLLYKTVVQLILGYVEAIHTSREIDYTRILLYYEWIVILCLPRTITLVFCSITVIRLIS